MSIAQLIRSFNASSIVPFYLTPTLTLHNPNAYGISYSDYFGRAVAIFENRVVVGAYTEDDAGGTDSGKAYIFDVTTGSLLHTLNNPNAYSTSAEDFFGYSVAIFENRVVVGAYREDDANGLYSGKVYIFDASTGSLLRTLHNPNAYGASDNDQFGHHVAINGNYVVVGAYGERDAGGTQSGKVYIFDASTGSLLRTLHNPNAYGTSELDSFGISVAISGNYAVVGAWLEDDAPSNNSGKVYIFDVTTGSLLHTLHNPNAYGTSASDNFGYSVSISGNHVAVGAFTEDDASGTDSGKVYIFDASTGSLLRTFNNPNAYGASANDYFGTQVAVSGNHVVVGAYGEGDSGGTVSGKAYIFDVTTGSLLHTLNNPNPVGTSANDYFGGAVSISGNRVVVGAYREDYLGSDSGSVYVYQIP